MRGSPAEYSRLDLLAHDLLRDVPLYDVSVVDLPGGGAGRSVADIRALESGVSPSPVASAIYGLRIVGINNRSTLDDSTTRPSVPRTEEISA